MTKRKIKYDHRNFRKHSDENKAMIRKSLEELGAGRSVVVDADDELIAGNGVCEQLNRKCRMMELDPQYCDVIIARWEKLTGKKAVKL